MTALRVRRSGREALVNADVFEPRLLVLDLLVCLLDQFESGIRDGFIIVTPLAHGTHRVGIDLRGEGDVIALPGVGFVLLNLLLNIRQVALADI